jgi:enhanced disease susceptibility 1 protein
MSSSNASPSVPASSCASGLVEELQAEMSNGRSLEDLRVKVTKLESDAHGWLTSGSLGKDVLLSSSFFVVWWKTLPEQHKSASCILKLMPQWQFLK